MILVTTMIGSRIVRRIESLESQVDRIASGNFDIVQPQGPEDAIRRLSISINSMSSQLAKAQEWIARTERSRLISMIAGGMAHQLRNALTGASLLVQSYIRSHPGERMEELAMAENQLRLASEGVRRLLASDPSIELVDEPDMSMKAISSAARDCVAAYAAHQQVDLVWDIDRTPGELLVPQGASVLGGLVNLLMNAIEAVGRHGRVVCESILLPSDSASAPIVLWRVIDNGPGPDPVGVGQAMVGKRLANSRASILAWQCASAPTSDPDRTGASARFCDPA
jgi:signal transduction histidine kinase